MKLSIGILSIVISSSLFAAVPEIKLDAPTHSYFKNIKPLKISNKSTASPFTDVPITYNRDVQKWLKYFQKPGRKWFRRWLERSYKYLPDIQRELEAAGLPKDLAYISMIESGFSTKAVSHASAVGPWQFMAPTADRFGLNINSWIDERRDFPKSTKAAIAYMKVLHKEFNSWYLVAAAYNTGEGRVRRYIKRYKTKDFWELSRKKAFVEETKNYIPKFIAAVLISKAPQLYGFKNLKKQKALPTEQLLVPGGTELDSLADHLKITRKSLRDMNPELLLAKVPRQVTGHIIRVPKGAAKLVNKYVASNP